MNFIISEPKSGWIDSRNDPNNKVLKFAQEIFLKQAKHKFVKVEDFKTSAIQVRENSFPTEPSFYFHSSGTSGDRKLIQHTERSMAASVYGLQKFLELEEISSWCCLPLNHVAGMMQIMRAKLTGGTVFFFNFRELLSELILQDVKDKWISLVPTQLYHLVKSPVACRNLRNFKGIFVGGAALSEKLACACRIEELPLFPSYGMTETSGMVTLLNKSFFLDGKDGVGQVLPHASLKKDSLDKKIMVRSDSMAVNLFKNDPTTEWLNTPDFGKHDNNGNWWIEGRSDRMIISGGEKVNPEQIENQIAMCKHVDDCYISGQKNEKWGNCVVAHVMPKNLDLNALKEYAKRHLSPHEIPKEWYLVEELPLSDMGKSVV